ncbi:MAG: hypothetical protein M9897_11675 [Brumimicrobium sp.]|nr:hypothetical protein [Brumimicrobium sp.]
MRLFLILSSFLFITFSFGQNEWWKPDADNTSTTQTEKPYPKGEVHIKKNSSIDKIIKYKATAIPPNTTPVIDGYRVQLFFDQNKTNVEDSRREVLRNNPTADTYVQYKAPNYILLYGNFRGQLEAEKARASLLSSFPESIVIKDKIEFPQIKEKE